MHGVDRQNRVQRWGNKVAMLRSSRAPARARLEQPVEALQAAIPRTRARAACSSSRVKALPLRAHGTAMGCTPCFGHFTRGTDAVM